MPGYQWLSLTTDYGLSDGFVAACHGVVARIAPAVRMIDVTHLVPAGDVAQGAAVLAQTVPHLPPGVHVAVVDPGVGTARRGIAVRTPGGLLVGPDNGLLPWAAEALGGVTEAVELTNPEWFPDVSRTFHGRDVFAPAAARFALGAALVEAGPPIDPTGLVRLPDPLVAEGDGWLEAGVLTVDHFGNVQLAAPGSTLDRFGSVVRIGDLRVIRGATFGDAPPGELVAYRDSAGRLALAVNGGRAADVLGVAAGDLLRLERPAGTGGSAT
ncbi:SAM hydrolase/SAM-dependent halogenase family protein [Plantactinospora soyae]|uniref:S-adenosylmethionine hydrolase n=1 Tax=Plantactinospora soyae TaxID=1544732 RepID=A0A927M6M0_9ACTN|nr:SAM-dependent chlorinase/fluorinase [Plantactinospora soyae]MBE1487962.1 S-adenosylmethionine hydrolase [Plantactinospora soyae]